ncbi:uncharacterized protein LAESUDRAFT_125500 [Laetiporus sulphureus 93-53]|uniref:Uncharacterized protein n=1 Tax=Laetiporus sulphureus 93-53 TaxID=1314785 RepID=A0A165EM79_9APHY|nr:uncharacterized protein LAESUDRAFT_125500 [Laetiporus sulphureus 93-53]KZT07351.1 hypothetical protein LAESUDRAFT_125500 [Laetiporus sulphureus 93-53]
MLVLADDRGSANPWYLHRCARLAVITKSMTSDKAPVVPIAGQRRTATTMNNSHHWMSTMNALRAPSSKSSMMRFGTPMLIGSLGKVLLDHGSISQFRQRGLVYIRSRSKQDSRDSCSLCTSPHVLSHPASLKRSTPTVRTEHGRFTEPF